MCPRGPHNCTGKEASGEVLLGLHRGRCPFVQQMRANPYRFGFSSTSCWKVHHFSNSSYSLCPLIGSHFVVWAFDWPLYFGVLINIYFPLVLCLQQWNVKRSSLLLQMSFLFLFPTLLPFCPCSFFFSCFTLTLSPCLSQVFIAGLSIWPLWAHLLAFFIPPIPPNMTAPN